MVGALCSSVKADIWKRPNLRYYQGVCLEGLRKTARNIKVPGILAEI